MFVQCYTQIFEHSLKDGYGVKINWFNIIFNQL